MERFFGMMPSNEIEKSVTFKDRIGLKIIIDAGPNGWTIEYADGGTQYKDESKGTDANFNEAFKCAEENLGKLTQLTHRKVTEGTDNEFADRTDERIEIDETEIYEEYDVEEYEY